MLNGLRNLDDVQKSFSGKSMINNLGLFNYLLNTRLKQRENVSDHVPKLESQFSRLAGIDTVVEEKMKVAMLVVSLTDCAEEALAIASVHTVQQQLETWEHTIIMFIEEYKSVAGRGKLSSPETRRDGRYLTKRPNRANKLQRRRKRQGNKKTKCYRCGKLRQMAQNPVSGQIRGRIIISSTQPKILVLNNRDEHKAIQNRKKLTTRKSTINRCFEQFDDKKDGGQKHGCGHRQWCIRTCCKGYESSK